MEVSLAIERIGEEPSLCAVEQVTVDAVRRCALTSSEDEPNRAAEECREHVTHGSGLRHADVVNVRIERPSAHVTDTVASELTALARAAGEVEGAVIGDWIEGVVAAAENIHRDQVEAGWEAHVVHLTVERIGAGKRFIFFDKKINFSSLRIFLQDTS